MVGGAQYRYLLLSVVLLSSLIAMQLQQMAGKLGIVHRKGPGPNNRPSLAKMASLYPLDCDRACPDGDRFSRSHRIRDCPPPSFWLALAFSILITIFDVFLLLGLMHLGFRRSRAIVSTLILTILAIFGYLVFLSKPDIGESSLASSLKKRC